MNYLINLLRPPWKKQDSAAGERWRLEDPTRVYFEREMARAIAQALLGNPEQGKASLARLTARLEKRLRNRGRVNCLSVCVASALVVVWVASFFLTDLTGLNGSEIGFAAVMGSLGALLSTAVGLRKLRLDPGAVSLMNFVYGGQRMLVGVLGAVVLYIAVRSGAVQQLLPGVSALGVGESMSLYQLALLSVLAGFSERLVPDLLDRNAAAAAESRMPTEGRPAPQIVVVPQDAASTPKANGQGADAGATALKAAAAKQKAKAAKAKAAAAR